MHQTFTFSWLVIQFASFQAFLFVAYAAESDTHDQSSDLKMLTCAI